MKKFGTMCAAAAVSLLAACGPADNTQSKKDADVTTMTDATSAQTDPYLWLEEVTGDRALKWVEGMNKLSQTRLESDPRFTALKEDALKVYNASDKIAYARFEGGKVANFWQDSKNVRGLWREADYDSYASGNPVWETVLDFDKLATDEGENWVYSERNCLRGTDLCLVSLSRGGSDAVVVREFDKSTGKFVDGGFHSPESKQWVAWLDQDTLLIATDFGDNTMNKSGYPSQVRLWKRGTPLESAELLLNDPSSVFNFPVGSHRKDGFYAGVTQGPDFFTQRLHILEDGQLKQLNLPLDIDFKGFYQDRLVILARKDWQIGTTTVPAGNLVLAKVKDALADKLSGENITVIAPRDDKHSLDEVTIGADRIYLTYLADVTSYMETYQLNADGTETQTTVDMPKNGAINIISADGDQDRVFLNFESHLQPDSLYAVGSDLKAEKIASLPARFATDNLVTEQHFATSKDGTKVPYFIVRRKDIPMDGSTPTLLYGYGGFEISLTPSYLGGVSRLWVENGGAYVVANIRGGGEYGPAWHQAALKENRQRAYDDFIAVGEHLIDTGVTNPKKLGIRGGSNGGLLMGVMTTQRPDLWNAVITAVPLLDMKRYNKLLAGDSWVGEYGNPDNPAEWDYIKTYSPYQKVTKDADYPEVFYYTSTKDDRVHPGHARKMAHKMTDFGHEILYYEIIEGGHSAAANLKQRAYTDALQTVYLMQKLMD